MWLVTYVQFLAGTRVKKQSSPCGRNIMDRDLKISQYRDLLDLGDDLYECDKRKVIRKTTKTVKSSGSKDILTFKEIEEITFS